jgi:serine/threonine-protein kinase RsbT
MLGVSVVAPSVRVPIREDCDVAMARKHVRELAGRAGLSDLATHALATAVSEIASNIVVHVGAGELVLSVADEPGRFGVVVVARDHGSGIREPERAMQDGYSTAHSLGLGLSSARRLVDEFELVSEAGRGTTVILRKWAG